MRYEIAGLLVEMSPGGRTAAQAEAYLASAPGRPPDFTIRADARAALARCPELGSEDLAEYLATGDCFALGLLAHGGMMLHAAAVEYRGRAVCFSALHFVGPWAAVSAVVLTAASVLLVYLSVRGRGDGTSRAGAQGR